MAKSKETYNKKEKEKKKQKQKEEKKQRMEERKANKKEGGSLDDMIAYVDEDGNLTDKPVDPSKRKEINVEDIQLGVTRVDDGAEDEPKIGKVTFFNTGKGFGFINDSVSGERLFFHISDVNGELEEMDMVTYVIGRGPRGLVAQQISRK